MIKSSSQLIELDNLSKIYPVGETQVHALRGISYTIEKGEMLAVMGPSGSGKSTLMNIIGCLDRPTSGTYKLEGREVSQLNNNELAGIRNKKIGFVFQTFNLLSRTAAVENAELPLLYSNTPVKEAREKALRALSQVGLKGREWHKTNQLSGGERQRVAIARALVSSPSLILADEPTGNLDTRTGEEIMDIFKRLHSQEGITIILVTHDPEVAEIAENILHIRDGQIERKKRRPA
jgi:putative ABC transport system ATP-binding protein